MAAAAQPPPVARRALQSARCCPMSTACRAWSWTWGAAPAGACRCRLRQPDDRFGVLHLSQSCPYNFGVVTESLNEVSYDMPTATWRSVYSGQARTAEEILVDEIAKALGADAVAMRRTFLKTAEGAPCSTRSPPKATGVGQCRPGPVRAWRCMASTGRSRHAWSRSTAGAQSRGSPKPSWHWTWAPGELSGLRAQAMGSLMDGISTVLLAGNHLDDGAFREGSYSDFKYARQADAPLECEVHLSAEPVSPVESASCASRRQPARWRTPMPARQATSPVPSRSTSEEHGAQLRIQAQRRERHGRRAGRHAPALGAARPSA